MKQLVHLNEMLASSVPSKREQSQPWFNMGLWCPKEQRTRALQIWFENCLCKRPGQGHPMSLDPALPLPAVSGWPCVLGVRLMSSKVSQGVLTSMTKQAWNLKGRFFSSSFQTCVFVWCACVCEKATGRGGGLGRHGERGGRWRERASYCGERKACRESTGPPIPGGPFLHSSWSREVQEA